MKPKFIIFLLAMFSCFSLLAQTLTGEKSPCPGVEYKYSITLAVNRGTPRISMLENGKQTNNMTVSNSGTNITYTFSITWDDYYFVEPGTNSPQQSTFEVTDVPATGVSIKYPIKVTIKALGDARFTSVPSPVCTFRGPIAVSVNTVVNATRYFWTNDAGWGNNNATTTVPNTTFNVNNSNTAGITVTIFNDACGGISHTLSTGMGRTAVTATPVFASGTSTMVCPAGTGTASVSMSDGTTPAQYEWYSYQPGFLNINGQGNQFTSAAPLVTTSPSVSLTYNNTTGGSGKEVSLAVRAVYTSNCKSPESFVKIGTGEAVSDRFKLGPSEQPAAFFGVCPSAVLYIYPNNNYTSGILEQEWEVVSGDYASLTGTNPIRLRMIDDPSSVLLLRYRFRIACGWSNWNNLRLYNTTCDGLVGAKVSTTQENIKATAKASGFNISPNPASSRISVNMPVIEKLATTMQLTVMNLKGEVVIDRVQAAASQFQVDVSTLTSGNYILQVQSGSHRYAKQFIVVK